MRSQRKTRFFGLTNFQIATLILLALADGGLILVLIVLLGIDVKTLLSYYFFITFIPLIVSSFCFRRFGGSMKRGVLVWREDLPKDMEESLRYVWQDIEHDNGFIRVEGNLRLVGLHRPYNRTAWPYVACIDLGVQSPKIEYRTGLAGVLFLIPLLIVLAPFIVIMMGLSHFIERDAIRGFILDMRKYDEQ